MGRFTIPDWADSPISAPYANFGNPQSLSLYSYVQNNPTTLGDPDGHSWIDPVQFQKNSNDVAVGAAKGEYNMVVGAWNSAANLLNAQGQASGQPYMELPEFPAAEYSNVTQAVSGAVAQVVTIVAPVVRSLAGEAATGEAAGKVGGSSTSASKVDKIVDAIDEGGFKVKGNPKTPNQEGNVTITHPNEPGAKLNLRDETHPIQGSNGKPVRHVNVETVKPRTGTQPRRIKNTHTAD